MEKDTSHRISLPNERLSPARSPAQLYAEFPANSIEKESESIAEQAIATTEMKLATTPTAGVPGEHSPYYRRLLSAGYKGFIQGTLGGSLLYGMFGLAIGAAVFVPAMVLAPALGTGALLGIPVMAGLGMLKGASTFGNIGSMAAISAESADLAEQRRYLLDRYYELPEGVEGDKQAELIKLELKRLNNSDRPRQFFHWKTVATCAVIGALAAMAFMVPPMIGLVTEGPLIELLSIVSEGAKALAPNLLTGARHHIAISGLGMAIGASIGGLAGATFGIDRHYIRRWFDSFEQLLHDNSHTRDAKISRTQQIDRLKLAAQADAETRLIIERGGSLRPRQESTLADSPAPITVALEAPRKAEAPQTRIGSIQHAQTVEAHSKFRDLPA